MPLNLEYKHNSIKNNRTYDVHKHSEIREEKKRSGKCFSNCAKRVQLIVLKQKCGRTKKSNGKKV